MEVIFKIIKHIERDIFLAQQLKATLGHVSFLVRRSYFFLCKHAHGRVFKRWLTFHIEVRACEKNLILRKYQGPFHLHKVHSTLSCMVYRRWWLHVLIRLKIVDRGEFFSHREWRILGQMLMRYDLTSLKKSKHYCRRVSFYVRNERNVWLGIVF